MELVESHTRQDADLGATFISHKEVTINFNGDELKKLLAIQMVQKENTGETKCILDEDEFETLGELLGHILEGISNYDLV